MPKKKQGKPSRPLGFPLFAHATGRWAKKVRGRLRYFGPWEDRDGALERWLAAKDDLLAGREPRVSGAGLTVKDLCNRFLTHKRRQVDAGELMPRSWKSYRATCARVLAVFGKARTVEDLRPDDFGDLRDEFAKTHGPAALGVDVAQVKTLFRHAVDFELIERPARMGPGFVRPSLRAVRAARADRGSKLFEPGEVRAMLEAADPQLRGMLFLAISGGYGASDCATLPVKAIDFDAAICRHARPKTQIRRTTPLWPEVCEVLRTAIANRPDPKDAGDGALVFLKPDGSRWARDHGGGPVSKATRKIMERVGRYRPGRSFYSLRSTFATVADSARDPRAVQSLMGHSAAGDVTGIYVEKVSDERLRAVSEHVHDWLWPRPTTAPR